MAEGAGFEPANLSVNGFQDRRLRPLGHPSDFIKIFVGFRFSQLNLYLLVLLYRSNPVNSIHIRD